MQCPSCGAANALGARFCGACGAPAPAAASAARAAPTVPVREGAGLWWGVAIVALVLGAATAPFLVAFPWRSLMVPGAAPTLVGDAALGLLVGIAALVGGVLSLRAFARDEVEPNAAWIAGGVAGFFGALFALLLTAEAYRLAHAEIVNGYVEDNEGLFLAAAIVSFLALVGSGIALIPGGDRQARLRVVVGALGVALGVALAGACAWTMASADALQAAAAARVERNTPNAQLLLMVASLSMAALLWRRLRRA